VLERVAEVMARGDSITVVAVGRESHAAGGDLLNVSAGSISCASSTR